MRTLTSVETSNFKMVSDILRTIQRLSKLRKFGSHSTLCFGCHKRKAGRVPKDLAPIENVTFNANQNARGLGVLSTSLEGVVDACKKLCDFFVQYLKF